MKLEIKIRTIFWMSNNTVYIFRHLDISSLNLSSITCVNNAALQQLFGREFKPHASLASSNLYSAKSLLTRIIFSFELCPFRTTMNLLPVVSISKPVHGIWSQLCYLQKKIFFSPIRHFSIAFILSINSILDVCGASPKQVLSLMFILDCRIWCVLFHF